MSEELKKFIQAELEGNLSVLIDPKKKDSFSQNRINVWSRLVSERIVEHLPHHLKKLNE